MQKSAEIQKFVEETGVALSVHTTKGAGRESKLRIAGRAENIHCLRKPSVTASNVGTVCAQINQLNEQAIVLTHYTSPAVADAFKDNGVMFIDSAGNGFLQLPGLYVFVKGNKSAKSVGGAKTRNLAFEPGGLKVIFALLSEAALVDAAYRVWSARAGVALGTVVNVVKGLKAAGYLLEHADGSRSLINTGELVRRWSEVYPDKLQPKCYQRSFLVEKHDWWQHISIQKTGARWGGEVAAANYVGNLQPESMQLFVMPDALTELARVGRLRKFVDGASGYRVDIYQPFWADGANEHWGDTKTDCVPPLLAYAELLATADPRNVEAAGEIYEQYFAGS